MPRLTPRASGLLVALLAAAAYLGTLRGDLVWDDRPLLGHFTRTVAERGIGGLLAARYLEVPELDLTLEYYRPVPALSLWLDRQLGGGRPAVFHATNLALHAACSALVRAAFAPLLGQPAALAAAVLFAVHPVHAEGVAFVSARGDLWAALFCLAATLFWARSRSGARPARPAEPPKAGRGSGAAAPLAVAGSSAAYFLALLSKEAALVLPAALLAWTLVLPAREGEGRLRGSLPWLGGWTLALLAAAGLRAAAGISWGVPSAPPAGTTGVSPPYLWAAATYLRLLAVPWPLRPVYAPDSAPLTIAAAAGALLCLGLFGWAVRVDRRALGGAAWAALFLAPGLALLGTPESAVAERLLYLPSAGFCAAAGVLWARLRAVRPRLAAGGLAALALALAAASAVYADVWRTELSLQQAIVRAVPRVPQARYNLANALAAAGREAEAEAAFRAALALQAELPHAWHGLGNTLRRQGRPAEALRALWRAVEERPGEGSFWNSLGVVLREGGDSGRAAEAFGKAVALLPRDAVARENLAYALADLGASERAAEELRIVTRLAPDRPLAAVNLGFELGRLGRHAEAADVLRGASRRWPERGDARYYLAAELLTLGDRQGAAAELRVLEALDPALAQRLRKDGGF